MATRLLERQADRSAGADESLNPVAVLRFLCRACERSCSRVPPACIAPRRWYDWAVQQVVLLTLLAGGSVHRCAVCTGRDRHAVRRWRDWLRERSDAFAYFLRSRHPEFGRLADHAVFWPNVIDLLSLEQAIAIWSSRDARPLKRRQTAWAPARAGAPTHFGSVAISTRW